MEITKRAVLYITTDCNLACGFCYFRFARRSGHAVLSDVTHRLDVLKEQHSMEYVDLTGGEPTLHPQVIDIVTSARRRDLLPTIISNGIRSDLLSALIDSGLEDLLLSVHGVGHNHDISVNVEGAFNTLLRTVSLLRNKGFGFRTNTVLTRHSCDNADELALFLRNIAPRIVNLISFNPYENSAWRNKHSNDFQCCYRDQAATATRIIDILEPAGIWANVRYIPLCFMKGYESHVCNFLQLQHDPYEWEFGASNLLSPQEIDDLVDTAAENCVLGTTRDDKYHYFAMQRIVQHNKTVHACSACSHRLVCDHIYTQYLEEYGDDGYEAYSGETVTDPLVYRRMDTRWKRMKPAQ
jgi:MoaA/NifB/PqqE/SkfB family radical SAM enzyme